MEKTISNLDVIETTYKGLYKIIRNTKTWGEDKSIIELYGIMADCINAEIHGNLTAYKSKENEAQIRNLIRRYVIGGKEKNTVWIGALSCIESKLTTLLRQRNRNNDLIHKYMSLYDDFMALASFRSFKHFCLYMETDWDKKVWQPTTKIFDGWYFYANQMVLDGKIKFIEKQLPTGYGKCSVPWTKVRTPNGITTLEDIQVGDSIYSMQNNRLVTQTVTNKWYSKKKQVKIVTRGGVEIIVSPEHKLYTQKGYLKAEEISCNDYLYRLCSAIEEGTEQNDDELAFATYMLFEGCCLYNHLSFTQEDNLVLKDFMSICDRLGFKYRIVQKKDNKGKEVHIWQNDGRPAEILAKYGMLNCLAKHKTLSNLFLDLPISQRFKFIGMMLATDGFIPNGRIGVGSPCGISLASKELVKGIQELLNSCGIYSAFCERVVKFNNKEFNAYVLSIPDEYLHIIHKNCYCFDKQPRLEKRMQALSNLSMKPYSNNTTYPKEVVAHCKEFKRLVNKQFSRNKSFKREVVEDFANKTGLLQDVIYKDFVFEQIKSVEYIDETVDMIDIEVSNTHNFIANDIVSHNSFSDCMLIAWIFGIDINNDVLKVFGNKFNCERAFDSVCDLMCSKRFAKVFPYYQKFEGKRENVFATCKQKDGTFKIEGSSKPVNFLTVGKESKISGVRAKFIFLDDITQAEDAASIRMHDKDISTYKEVWFKRRYSSDNFYIIASGTTYSIYDILSWLKSKFGGEKAVKSKVNKYTKVGVSNQICMNGASVFICVPKLDYDTDESTYPEEYPTEQARQQRQDDYESFMAMEQQTPCTPKNSPFYMSNLQEYEELPEINTNGRTSSCWAYLDGKRKGSDFCSMPIFTPINNKHYLIDAFYDNRAMKECYNGIIAKIVQHHITKLYIENNINEGLKTLLDKMLFERGITFCKIEEVYNTAKKDVRIANAEAEIKANVVFPKFGLYARSSPIGQAMDELYGYSYVKKNEHDDFTDSLAGYVECFVSQNIKQMATISIFGR